MRAVIALVVLAGCTERIQLGDDPLPGLVALELAPATTTIAFDELPAPAQVVALTAVGRFEDGTTRDVTALVEWHVDNPAPLELVEPGHYLAHGEAAGHVRIRAAHGAIAAAASATVVISATIVDDVFPPPPGVEQLFAPGVAVGTDPARRPALRYPSQDTLFPQGLARILFQHDRGGRNDAIRMAFESDVLHLVVLTGSDRWRPDEAVWSLIARSHPGTSVELELAGADSTGPGTIHVADPVTLRFSRATIADRIYYFSEATNGVVRGSIAASSATAVFAPSGDDRCAGCHAISRDGRRMAVGHGGEKLAIVDLATLEPILPVGALPMGWAAFAPDGERVVIADRGTLVLRDATTGAPIGPGGGKVPLPAGVKASHPDWSPDGTALAVVVTGMLDNMTLSGGSIAQLPFAGGAWGALEVVVPSAGDTDNNFFPRWSPDGDFIAYVHAASPSRAPRQAELRLVRASGGTPITLRAASSRIGTLDDVPDLGSTMPAWTAGDDGLAWLAFSSTRPYGLVRPAKGDSQIWIAGLDLAREGDPSFAAFWLPCQDITTLANDPIWAPLPEAGPE